MTHVAAPPTRHLFSVRYRRNDHPSREYRMTVVATSADEARAFVALRDSAFHSTPVSPRKGRAVVEPEGEDGITASKRREWVQEHPGYVLVADEAPE
jgi:hypothetical protein